MQWSYNLSVNFMRQRVFSVVSSCMAEYIENLTPEELLDLAEKKENMVNVAETELYKRVHQNELSKNELNELARKAAPYISCFSENDFDTVIERTVKSLGAEHASHASILLNNREWFRQQINEAWNRLVKTVRIV